MNEIRISLSEAEGRERESVAAELRSCLWYDAGLSLHAVFDDLVTYVQAQRKDGYNEGWQDGWDEGNGEGYDDGYQAKEIEIEGE